VIAVVLRDRVEALKFWDLLLQHGIYVNLMLPPATPDGVSLIRCSVSAAHTPEQIDTICAAFADLLAAVGIVAAECDAGG
jgi:8-amino-7-oxononanoate synthase